MIRSVIFVVFVSIALSSFGNAASGVQFEDLKQTVKKSAPYLREKEFSFGERVDGDGAVGVFAEVQFFDDEQDVEVTVAYPNVGKGKLTVNYVEVYVLQETSNTDAEISSGGINEQNAGVKVTAKGTKVVAYEVVFYGFLKP